MRWGLSILIFFFLISFTHGSVVESGVLSTLQYHDNVRVIVTYEGKGPITHLEHIDGSKILVGTLSKNELSDLSNDPTVQGIYLDWKLSITRDDGWDIINADTLNFSVNGTNLTGASYSICVLDTGIDYTHPEFGSCNTSQFENGNCPRFPYGFDYVNDDDDPWDDESHGTHVTGIINKIAPGVNIIPMKVCDDAGDCYVSDMVTAVSWCNVFRSVYNITVITMSVGDGGAWSDDNCFPSDPLAQQINNARNNNIFITSASGNEGYTTGINYPACVAGAVSIGATTDSDSIASITNRYSTLDLMAPGYQINSTYPGGSYVQKSGTSMATPFAAAAGILIQQYHTLKYNLTLTPEQIENKLKTGGVMVSNWPRIDLNGSISAGYECYIDDDCTADAWLGDAICINDALWQNYSDYSCNYGNCTLNISLSLKETCTNGCTDGSCIQISSGSSGSSNGGITSIDKLEIITNNEWALHQEVEVIVKVYDQFGKLYDADKIELVLINNKTGFISTLDVPIRTDKGEYKLNVTPITGLGSYILEAKAFDGYYTKTAQKPVELVRLSHILTLQSIGFQDAEAPGILTKLYAWLKKLAWGQKWP